MPNLPLYRFNNHDTPTGRAPNLRLVIFEDNHDFRESLLHLFHFTPDIEVAGAFSDCSNLAQHVSDLLPGVILMDIDMPGMNGIEATLLVKEISPETQVVMLTVSEEEDRIFQALRNGATGYLLKKAEPDEIVEAVRAVCTGGSPMTPAIARKVLQFFHGSMEKAVKPEAPAPKASETQFRLYSATLTHREQEILEALVDGLSYKMIAGRYFISTDTVKNHIQGIYRKLHVNSKGEAISFALKNGIAGQKNDT
jgi:DNA-binding NarL/FixJ family response regulator